MTCLTTDPACDLVLYTNPMSRGRIARWMMEEAGQPYRAVVLDYGLSMKSQDYLRLNPMGKVPTLVHCGKVVTEAAAICAYMADAFPQAGLAPAPADRAAYYRWMFFAAGPVEQAVVDRSRQVPPAATHEQRGTLGYGSYEQAVDALCGAVSAASPWIAGTAFSAADVYVGSHVMWGLGFGTLPKRPELQAYAARLAARPAHIAASRIDDALIAAAKPAGPPA